MIRKLASGQYQLYSRKRIPRLVNVAILGRSAAEKQPNSTNAPSSILRSNSGLLLVSARCKELTWGNA